MSLRELEHDVVQTALDYVEQLQHGLFRDIPRYRKSFYEAVHALNAECGEERWHPEMAADLEL